MIRTEFLTDFTHYHAKAQILQDRNEGFRTPESVKFEDPIMTSVHIYDCVHRRQAGFSNVLEDLHGKKTPESKIVLPKSKFTNNKLMMRYLHLFHRFTGSGASFEKDHGYRNSHTGKLSEIMGHRPRGFEATIKDVNDYIIKCKVAMVTSKGNQPPSLKNHMPEKYRLAMQYYFDNHAKEFITDYSYFLESQERRIGIKQAVDWSCMWHKERGFKQWKFVLTAFVMDDAEYYPSDVDPKSHCYYGANCIKAFDLMFIKEPIDKMKKAEWYEKCMAVLVDITGNKPYNLEDVCCDMIRYWTEYIPKGYEHLSDSDKTNNSLLKVNGEYTEYAQKRLKEVLK